MERFGKSFTQQEPISEVGIARAVEVLRSGRLHRYNVDPGETGFVAALERAFADYIGQPFCLAATSGGQAMQIALRAAGIVPGDRVLTNAFTLAPVPGAIALVGAVPVLVETTDELRPDLADLESKANGAGAKALLLSNMRGHLPDMEAVTAICARHDLILIEDCAHTMGATWKGRSSGTFGLAGCFSTQTYKHMNSGEGGLLVASDAGFMARATMLSGSYMMYARHGAGPGEADFDSAKYHMPNGSARMDAVRAAILLDQIASMPDRIERWNALYRAAAAGFATVRGVTLPRRPQEEGFVGSSIQFLVSPDWTPGRCRAFIAACAARGVELKWFGAQVPHGFTSRFDHWHFAPQAPLPRTSAVLARLFDMRLPLTFTPADCTLITRIIAEETASATEAA
jgi:dTDP-4-amino-4,6-dideoxygalactose transaminase